MMRRYLLVGGPLHGRLYTFDFDALPPGPGDVVNIAASPPPAVERVTYFRPRRSGNFLLHGEASGWTRLRSRATVDIGASEHEIDHLVATLSDELRAAKVAVETVEVHFDYDSELAQRSIEVRGWAPA